MVVLSVNISLPREIEWKGQKVRTSIFKAPVAGRVNVRRLNIDGDAQADLNAHGGEHRALMVYQQQSYDYWSSWLKRTDLHYGQFGENLTVDGLPDSEVCIGDRYQIGTAIFEVTQPRVTCYKVAISLGVPEMPALLVAHHRPGFYFRVIREGEIGQGDPIIKIAGGPEGMSISVIDALLYSKDHPIEQVQKALRISALSKGWQWSFQQLVDASLRQADASPNGRAGGNAGLTGLSKIPSWPGFRSFVICKTNQESVDVRSFLFAPADGQPLPDFSPGQHIAIRLFPGTGGSPVIRMYSLCGPNDHACYRIAVRREKLGAGSNYIHDHLRVGDTVELSAPGGSFTLSGEDRPVVLLSAGVGVTPVLAMLCELARQATKREVWWIYSTQNRKHHSFFEEAKDFGRLIPAFHSTVIYSRPTDQDRLGEDYDLVGHLTPDLLEGCNISKSAEYYICGPAPYLKDMLSFLVLAGVPEGQVHYEAFGGAGMAIGGKPPHLPAVNDGTGPVVTFVKSNISFQWQDRCPSLLDAAEACDVPVSWSCRSGVCHRCESSLLGGDVAYSPQPLDPAAQGNVLICCARPLSDVQLDL